MTRRTVLRLAAAEMRGGRSALRILIGCLTLGVAAIAAVGSVASAVDRGLKQDSRVLLGGDAAIATSYRAIPEDALRWLRARSQGLTQSAELRTMAGSKQKRILVELKAVDASYPLVGGFESSPALELNDVLAPSDGVAGAVVDPQVLSRLDVSLGDQIQIGASMLAIRAVIQREPDRRLRSFDLGPRVLVTQEALRASGVLAPGSIVEHTVRFVSPSGVSTESILADFELTDPDDGYRIAAPDNANPVARRFIDRLVQFLTLVGLTALVVGGVGVSNAVRAYLATRTQTIATYKCLGLRRSGVLALYLVQVLVATSVAIGLGVLIGAAVPWLVRAIFSGVLPVRLAAGLDVAPLAISAAFGLLTSVLFSLGPLDRVSRIKPARLFRSRVSASPAPGWSGLTFVQLILVGGLVALALLTAREPTLALAFLALSGLGFAVMSGAARAIRGLASRIQPRCRGELRLALSNLHRPGNITRTVTLSLGIGLSVLATVALVQGNLDRQLVDEIPAQAPTFFLVDIQSDQIAALSASLSVLPGVRRLERAPLLRGRIVAVNGITVDSLPMSKDARVFVESERGLTYRQEEPAGGEIVDGRWWGEEDSDQSLVSFSERVAGEIGVTVGDEVTVNVLGRNVQATVSNVRRLDWRSLNINFSLVFSPAVFEGAPHSFLAAAYMDDSAKPKVRETLGDRFENVSIVEVGDAIEAAHAFGTSVAGGLRLAAGFTILAGVFVLAGGILASYQKQVYLAVVLKVLGATRFSVLQAFALEYGILSLTTALVAGALGVGASYWALDGLLGVKWVLLPMTLAAVVTLCVGTVMTIALVGTWRVLSQKAAPLLRTE
ncbi:MAG: FtsX-like permease family protein [Myxococcota bacterium]